MHAAPEHPGLVALARPALEIADVVRAHGPALARARALTLEQARTLRAIERCRTAALGGHLDVCTDCGHQSPSYNSCRDRHCPKCQWLAQARWVEKRTERLLPVPYFHVVFTLPAELRAIAMLNRRLVFDTLFASASSTLLTLGRDPKRLGALLGVTAVLHTWTRDLRFHPHVHCIVTGGGWSIGEQRFRRSREAYLFPIRVLGTLFRGKVLAALDEARRRGELRLPDDLARDPLAFGQLRAALGKTSWITYAKRPFGGPEQVVRYLGRYTHRVGISNRRLVSMDERAVTFRTKDGKTASVEPVAFLARFIQHVLPARFVKIRHYGLLAPARVGTSLEQARAHLGGRPPTEQARTQSTTRELRDTAALVRDLLGVDITRCRACGARAVEPHPLARAPPHETTA
jgi:hypothetical protein